LLLAPLLLAVLLPACGGDGDSFVVEAAPRATAATHAPRPLLAADGSVLSAEPQAVPVDRAARTRRQHYASEAQALALENTLRGDVVQVLVGCCGAEAADMAVLTAYGVQAAMNLPDSAPFFVRGSDQRLAASVADRLAEAGMPRVFLVTR